MLTFDKSPADLAKALAARAKARRLDRNLTQAGIAARAGMSTSSYKRFERTGEIALASLIRVAVVFDAEQEFELLLQKKLPLVLDDLLSKKKARARGKLT